MERISRSFGRIMGDDQYNRASGAVRESSGLSAGVGEHRDPQPSEVISRDKGRNFFLRKEVHRPVDHAIGRSVVKLVVKD